MENTPKVYLGWFETKISKAGKEYGSGSLWPKDFEKIKKHTSSKGYCNFFWSIRDGKPSITLIEPREQGITPEQARQVFPDSNVSIDEVPSRKGLLGLFF